MRSKIVTALWAGVLLLLGVLALVTMDDFLKRSGWMHWNGRSWAPGTTGWDMVFSEPGLIISGLSFLLGLAVSGLWVMTRYELDVGRMYRLELGQALADLKDAELRVGQRIRSELDSAFRYATEAQSKAERETRATAWRVEALENELRNVQLQARISEQAVKKGNASGADERHKRRDQRGGGGSPNPVP